MTHRRRDEISLHHGFLTHPKTGRLRRALGDSGVLALLQLWECVAADHPDGDLAGADAVDIAEMARWPGDAADFVSTLSTVGFLDGAVGAYVVHEWATHQPFVAGRGRRIASCLRANEIRWRGGGPTRTPVSPSQGANRTPVATAEMPNRSPVPTSMDPNRSPDPSFPVRVGPPPPVPLSVGEGAGEGPTPDERTLEVEQKEPTTSLILPIDCPNGRGRWCDGATCCEHGRRKCALRAATAPSTDRPATATS